MYTLFLQNTFCQILFKAKYMINPLHRLKPKNIKLNTKTQFFFNNIQLLCTLKNFFFSFCFLVAPVKVYKKVVKFSFKRQKIFWVLVFSFIYLVLVDAMDRSFILENLYFEKKNTYNFGFGPPPFSCNLQKIELC